MSIRKPRGTAPRFEPLTPATAAGVCVRTYRVTLATPIYGGGVQAGVPDKDMPVRVSSIRGQLRFWWRLLNGQGKSPRELFVAERELWGGLGGKPEEVKASRVRLTVRKMHGFKTEQCADYQLNQKKKDDTFKSAPKFRRKLPPYALFPAQGELSDDRKEVQKQPAELFQPNATFELCVSLLNGSDEEFKRVLRPALRFWASFGGIGARTRRGLGSVKIEDLKPVAEDEAEQHGCKLVLRSTNNSKEAEPIWAESINKLRVFRQGPGFARNGNSSDPGRSRWPEPDAIRDVTGTYADQHPIQDWYSGKLFPRALFGLPIIFQFKDEKTSQNKSKNPGDPRKTILSVDGADRFASPLILKAYWNGLAFQPAALLLPTAEDLRHRSLKLAYTGAEHPIETFAVGQWWPTDSREVRRNAGAIQPLSNSSGDPLDAFLAYFVKD